MEFIHWDSYLRLMSSRSKSVNYLFKTGKIKTLINIRLFSKSLFQTFRQIFLSENSNAIYKKCLYQTCQYKTKHDTHRNSLQSLSQQSFFFHYDPDKKGKRERGREINSHKQTTIRCLSLRVKPGW